jgi:hypothetical protein
VQIEARKVLKPGFNLGMIVSSVVADQYVASDITGLSLDPPAGAAVFCVDEKTAIQALDRLDPVLPLLSGRGKRHGFEYCRHETLSLYPAFNTKSGKVSGQDVTRHTGAGFVALLTELVANQPKGKDIRLICDNLSANKTWRCATSSPTILSSGFTTLPPAPRGLTRSSCGSTASSATPSPAASSVSVADLKRELVRYIRQYDKPPKPTQKIFETSFDLHRSSVQCSCC